MLEVHLFDFDGDLYGQRLTVVPCARLRGEVNFAGLDALTRQIHADLAQARHYFRTATPLGAAALGLPCHSTGWTLPLASAPLAPELRLDLLHERGEHLLRRVAGRLAAHAPPLGSRRTSEAIGKQAKSRARYTDTNQTTRGLTPGALQNKLGTYV